MEKVQMEKLQISEDVKAALQESPISKLNDDCLINVFKYLSIKDRIVSERGIFIISDYFLWTLQRVLFAIFDISHFIEKITLNPMVPSVMSVVRQNFEKFELKVVPFGTRSY